MHSALLEPVSAASLEDRTLVWTLGEAKVPDDYEDVRAACCGRIFSASTQFDEPRALGDRMDVVSAG